MSAASCCAVWRVHEAAASPVVEVAVVATAAAAAAETPEWVSNR